MTDIIIPELEEYREAGIIRTGYGTAWSEEEENILYKYYGYAPTKELVKYLPGRTFTQVISKAARMGLTNRGKV